MTSATKTRLCRLDELVPNSAQRFDVGKQRVAVVRIGDDVYAIGDQCTHQNISLGEGEVDSDEKTIECWKHGSEFSVETGEALTLPATKPTPTYQAWVEDGDVVVVLDD